MTGFFEMMTCGGGGGWNVHAPESLEIWNVENFALLYSALQKKIILPLSYYLTIPFNLFKNKEKNKKILYFFDDGTF